MQKLSKWIFQDVFFQQKNQPALAEDLFFSLFAFCAFRAFDPGATRRREPLHKKSDHQVASPVSPLVPDPSFHLCRKKRASWRMLNIHSKKHKNCSTKVCQNKTNPKRPNESHRPLSKTGLWPCWECLVSQQPVARNGCLQSKPKIFGTHIKSIQGHSRNPKKRPLMAKLSKA